MQLKQWAWLVYEVLLVDYAILVVIKLTSKSLNRMKGMYSVRNFLNWPSIYLDKVLELLYSDQSIKTYGSFFEEFIKYCHKGVLTMLNTFINCGIVWQRTCSKTERILAISSVYRNVIATKPMKLNSCIREEPSKDRISIWWTIIS